jgi:hypothetical protein
MADPLKILLLPLGSLLFFFYLNVVFSYPKLNYLLAAFSHVYQWRNSSYLTLFTVLSGAPNTKSARQTPKYCFLVGHVCCIRSIPQYRLTLAEYRVYTAKTPFLLPAPYSSTQDTFPKL